MKRGAEEMIGAQDLTLAETVSNQLVNLGIPSRYINLLFYFNSNYVSKLRAQINEILAADENDDTKDQTLDYLNGLLAKAHNKNQLSDDELSKQIIESINHYIKVIEQYIHIGFQGHQFANLMIFERNNLPAILRFLKDHYTFFQEIIRYEVSKGFSTNIVTEGYVQILIDPNNDSFFSKVANLANEYKNLQSTSMDPRAQIIRSLAALTENAANTIVSNENHKLIAQQAAERRKLEEEKRKQEEARKRLEEEKRKQEEERKRLEEEKAKQEEARRKLEEKIKKQEEERKLEREAAKKQREDLNKEKTERKLAKDRKREAVNQLFVKYRAINNGTFNKEDIQTANLMKLQDIGFNLEKTLNLSNAVEIVNNADNIIATINAGLGAGPSVLYAALEHCPTITSAIEAVKTYSSIFKTLAKKGFGDKELSELFFHKNKTHADKFAMLEANMPLIIQYLDIGFSPVNLSRLLNKSFADDHFLQSLNDHFDVIKALTKSGIPIRGISYKLSIINHPDGIKAVIQALKDKQEEQQQQQIVAGANLIFSVYQHATHHIDVQKQAFEEPQHVMGLN